VATYVWENDFFLFLTSTCALTSVCWEYVRFATAIKGRKNRTGFIISGYNRSLGHIQEGKVLGRLGSGKAFGELAILYNCKRTASVKV
jgi:hypothetical protein